MIEFIKQPWPWYVAGPIISLVMFLLVYFGKNFGMSANLRTMCAMAGGDKVADFFDFDWKGQKWNLVFVLGAIFGGFVGGYLLTDNTVIDLAPATIASLENLGFSNVGNQYLPDEIFGMDKLTSLPGLVILLGGGFMVGFGARYAGGCTSGHAISGLSDLQIPSLIAVVGFFIGGLAMTYFILPIIY